MKIEEINKLKQEFEKDVEARRPYWNKMNYCYLQYKGIQILNYTYNKEVLESLGVQINIPRTFMTIESIRPDLNRPLSIKVKHRNKKERVQAEASTSMLNGEWQRSNADDEKAKAEYDGLIFGTGYLLSRYLNDTEITDIFDGYEKDGTIKSKKGTKVNYDGMKLEWIDPYYLVPDRKAKTYEPRKPQSPRRIWLLSVWDYDTWIEHAKDKGYNTDGLEKGGFIEKLDLVRDVMDILYTQTTLGKIITRDNGTLVAGNPLNKKEFEEDSVMVLEMFEPKRHVIFTGANWTVAEEGKNMNPDKIIPIFAIKDYDIPGELEGIGEPEILRWQQYEENKVHNLSYLQVIINTVGRYGIVKELLEDPTEMRSNNPLKPIYLKYRAGAKITDAIQPVNQHSSNDYPKDFLAEVKNIGQSATGQSDYNIGATESQVGTLGEAELMKGAGNKRTKQKIQTMEDTGIAPIIKHWMACIPLFYTEELDYLLNDGQNQVKFIPYSREVNKNAKLVAEYGVREGVKGNTIEEVFLNAGYQDVVFVSDLLLGCDVSVKTGIGALDTQYIINQYQLAISSAERANAQKVAMGQPPDWDVSKLVGELLRQFPDIIENPEDYKLQMPMPMGLPGTVMPMAQPSTQASQLIQPELPANLI
jgi:hypothetical protein